MALLSIISSAAITANAADPVLAIDTSKKTVIYENGFESADALDDFKQFNGNFSVKDGKAVLSSYSKSTNAFILYNGNDPRLKGIKDYIVEVDLYNVQTAAGLVAFCSPDKASEVIHGYAGYNIMSNSTGQKLAVRGSSEDGKSTPFLKVSTWRINPGDNIHIEAAVSGELIQVRFTDLKDGREIWACSAKNSDHRGASFGLMAYTKIYDGVLDCRKSSFDNLRVSLLSEGASSHSYKTVSGSFEYSEQAKATADNSLAVAGEAGNSAGTAAVTTFLPESGNAGLVFGHGADGSYYKLALSSDKKIHLIKVTATSRSTLKTTSLSAMGAGPWGACELRAVYNNGRIYCYLNDKCLLSYTDKSCLSGSGVGIFSDKAGALFSGLYTSTVAEPDKADIVVWGHSHMGGWYDAQDDLAKYGKVANLGVGGSNTPYWTALTEEICSYDADIIIVMSGSNDMGSKSAKQIAADLKNTFSKIKAKTPDVHFILITEWFQPSRIEKYESKVRQMETEWKAFADEDPSLVTIVDGFSIPLDANGKFSDKIFTDTSHFGINGYRELVKRVCAALDNVKAGVFTGSGSKEEKPAETTAVTEPVTEPVTDPEETTARVTEEDEDTGAVNEPTSEKKTDIASIAVIAASIAVIVVSLTFLVIFLKKGKK